MVAFLAGAVRCGQETQRCQEAVPWSPQVPRCRAEQSPQPPGHFMDTRLALPSCTGHLRCKKSLEFVGVTRSGAARQLGGDRQTAACRSLCVQWKWNIGSKHHIPPSPGHGCGKSSPGTQPGEGARWPLLFLWITGTHIIDYGSTEDQGQLKTGDWRESVQAAVTNLPKGGYTS